MARCFALATIALACHAQSVVVQPCAISGIEITGPDSPDFPRRVEQVAGSSQTDNLRAWLPYGIVIKNNTRQTIAALSVAWSAAMDNSSPLGHSGGLMPHWFNQPHHQLQPGDSVIALPVLLIRGPRELTALARGHGMGNLYNFQRAARLAVSVDAVAFSSGQYAGGDALQEYEQWQAEINAPRSVAATVLKMKSQPISDTLAWLQSLAQQRSVDPNLHMEGSEARGMLGLYNNKGEAALYSLAASEVEQPAFPLHR
jgi:hypothetical protein